MKTKEALDVSARPAQLLSIGAALLLSMTPVFGQAVQQPDIATSGTASAGDVIKLEKYEVTGSRIKRLDTETVSPVLQMTAEKIEAKGFPTFADAIRSLSINSGQALTPIDAGSSFTPGISTFNFRGLGNNSTLVLVNGRRVAAYGSSGFNGFQSMFDLNSIPNAAIDSIEILKDGGSALYGSDAVAGVLNIKLRKDYQGLNVSFGFGDYFNTSGATKTVSIITGATSGKASIMVAGNWRDQGGIQSRDLWYTRTANNNAIAGKANPYYAITGTGSLQNALHTYGLSDPVSDEMFDQSSATGVPGWVSVGGVNYTAPVPTSTPTIANMVKGKNYYDYQNDTSFADSARLFSIYTRGSYDFADWIKGAVELSFVHNEDQSDSAPAPATLASENSLITNIPMYIPGTNPYNPWGTDIKVGGRRLVEAGPRYNDVSVNSPRLLASLEGKIADAGFFTDWTWDTGALYSRSEVNNTAPGTVTDYRLQEALLGLVSDGKGGLVWNPTAPAANRMFFNWFGPNDPAFGRFLAVNNPTVAISQLTSYDIHFSGPLLHLPGGDLALSIGAEHYIQKQSEVVPDTNQTGNIIGGSNGMSWSGARTVTAGFAELNAPIFKWLEVQAAGRYETYSDDGFEKRVRPKFGVKIRPFDWLILRSSYAQSYKAPDLKYLYATQTVTFTSGQYHDPLDSNPSSKQQLEVHVTGDANLKPETTDTYYFGVVAEPQRGFLKGLTASVDFVRFEQVNLLAQLTSFYSYNTILSQAALGNEPFKDMVVRDPIANTLIYIKNPYTNISDRHEICWDFDINYRWRTTNLGDFNVDLNGTYTDSDVINGMGSVGNALSRRFHGNASVGWKRRDWAVNFNCMYIRGADDSETLVASANPAIGYLYIGYHIKDQYVFNAQVSYSGLWKSTISLGVTNIFNQRPPVDPTGTSGGFDDGVNWTLPASWFLKISKDF